MKPYQNFFHSIATAWRGRLVLLALALVALSGFAIMRVTADNLGPLNDHGTLDVQVADKTLCSADLTTHAGAKVLYSGDDCITAGSSGTGVFEPFGRIQGSPTEQGYNTDGTVQFETKTGKWTHAILVSDIPVVKIGGVDYWEVFVDINDSNSRNPAAAKISLNEVELWFTTNKDLVGYVDPTGFPVASGATKQYDFSGTILINDVNQGSGRADLRYAIPQAGITIPTNCDYGNSLCGTYFVLFSKWGTTANFSSDSGFEEWKTKNYATIELKKVWVPATAGQTTLNIGTGTVIGTTDRDVDTQLTGPGGTDPLTTGTNIVDASAAAQTRYVSETGGLTGYTTTLACTRNGVAFTPGASNSVQFAEGNLSHVVCTFTNTASPTTTVTEIHENPNHTAVLAVDAGSTVHDKATVTNSVAITLGTVTYTFYTGGDCISGTPDGGETVTVGTDSASHGPLAAGSYAFKAVYSGSGGFLGSTGVCEPLAVVDARISIGTSGTNQVNSPHTFTVTVEKDLGLGGGFVAASGVTVTASESGVGALTGTGTCQTGTTNASGVCTVIVNSSATGQSTVNASAGVVIGTVTVNVATNGYGANGISNVKTWVDARISIGTSGINEVNTAHTFTVTVEKDLGLGGGFVPAAGVTVTGTESGVGSITGGTCNVPTATDAFGQCTIIVNSSAAGQSTVNASAGVVIGTVTVNVATNGYGANSISNVKKWVDAAIAITPASDTNPVGTNHLLTVTVTVAGGVIATGGAPVTTTITSDTATSVYVGGVFTCTTPATGTSQSCGPLTITSSTTGTTVIEASSNIPIDVTGDGIADITLSRVTDNSFTPSNLHNSPRAIKIWVTLAQITPTGTTCADFNGGTAVDLNQVNYQTGGGANITNTQPGVFFYYVLVAATSANPVFTVTQSNIEGAALFHVHNDSAAQVSLYTAACANGPATNVNVGTGAVVTISVPGAASGTSFIIGIKYSPKSLVGTTAPASPPVTYTFEVTGQGGSADTLDLVKTD